MKIYKIYTNHTTASDINEIIQYLTESFDDWVESSIWSVLSVVLDGDP